MSTIERPSHRTEPEPLPGNITSVQPGGGVVYRLELLWGKLRRIYLRLLRPGYVRKMAALRRGELPPHLEQQVLDPRDLKYLRNQCTAEWAPSDDPFRWRDSIPFARWGLAELLCFSLPLVGATAGLFWLGSIWRYLAVVPLVLLMLVVWFFRDPPRRVPKEVGILVSPADGKIVEITQLPHDPFVGGPAIKVGMFLSLFNVHLNRSPTEARVISLRYFRGKFLSALRPECAVENESMFVGLEQEAPPHDKIALRQISGQVARRIVCSLRPGEVVERGQKFGMIKLGSRTEIIYPAEWQTAVKIGDRVKGGVSVIARRGKS